jgi:hypothetical protein
MAKKTEDEVVGNLVSNYTPEELARAYLRASRRAMKAEKQHKTDTSGSKLSGDDVMDFLRNREDNTY